MNHVYECKCQGQLTSWRCSRRPRSCCEYDADQPDTLRAFASSSAPLLHPPAVSVRLALVIREPFEHAARARHRSLPSRVIMMVSAACETVVSQPAWQEDWSTTAMTQSTMTMSTTEILSVMWRHSWWYPELRSPQEETRRSLSKHANPPSASATCKEKKTTDLLL